ncbi:hypothetical protein GGI22_001892 [Coemansia erecta]|nr:hypothetical protein GGI22_001892 [Coemansia erecta]
MKQRPLPQAKRRSKGRGQAIQPNHTDHGLLHQADGSATKPPPRARSSKWVGAIFAAAVMMLSMSLRGSGYVAAMPAVIGAPSNEGVAVAQPPSRNPPTTRTMDGETAQLLRPRSARLQYSSGVSTRWSHASVIADQAMYIFGGKAGASNAPADYASACLSLNLAASFSISNPPWYFTCAEKGPLVAGHSAVINSDINMAVLFGGSIPDGYESDASNAAAMHLFSAVITTWSTPENANIPQPLLNSSAVLHDATGDIIVYGGVLREDTSALSNSTLRMVTDSGKHDSLSHSPAVPFTDLLAPAASSAQQGAAATRSTQTTATLSSTAGSASVAATAAPSTTHSGSRTSSKPAASSSSTAEKPSPTAEEPLFSLNLFRRTHEESETPGVQDAEEPERMFARDAEEPKRMLARDAARENSAQLMAWTNSTLPASVSGRVGHTATVVGESSMVVLGGSDGSSLVGMDVVYVYNAMDQTWVLRSATGAVPPSRRSHVATVVNSTLVVVHGGANNDFTSAMGDVAVLDTATWRWAAPNVANAPAARYAHAAVQAGPYMLITFGYVLPPVASIADGDYGLYILDTSVWAFVSEFNAARSKLAVHYTSTKPTGGTIFGLLVASLVGLLVLLILFYIGCVHYYSRHPRLSHLGETTTMLPSTELRNFGRRLTGRFGTRRYRQHLAQQKQSRQRQQPQEQSTPWTMLAADEASAKAPVPKTALAAKLSDKGNAEGEARPRVYSSNSNIESTFSLSNIKHLSPVAGSGDDTSLRIMFDLSRESSFDHGFFAGTKADDAGGSTSANDSRLSKRIHLDDVELPAGLRNRNDSQSASHPKHGNTRKKSKSKSVSADANAEEAEGRASSQEPSAEHTSWSRPTTSGSTATRKSKHISAMLPRIVGSRLTLPTESTTALARYRFDELEEMPDPSFLSSRPVSGSKTTERPATLKDGVPAATIGTLVAANDARSSNSTDSLAPPVMPAAVGDSPASIQRRLSNSSVNSALSASSAQVQNNLRDSIDINAVFAQNHHFYVANPDN